MINVGLFYAWSSTSQHTENCLQNCNVLEKGNNFAHGREYNDMPVSIKVEEVRSRYAKYVYGYRRVECRSHEYKRDREPSRVPENMLKRLSPKKKKKKKLQSYVWSCLRNNAPKSSKIHRFIKHQYKTVETYTQDCCQICTKNEKETNF